LNGHGAARASAETLEQGRENHQVTFIPSDAMKVREALEKHNAGAEEGLVDALLGIIDGAGRGSVHSEERNAAVSQLLGSLQGQTGEILKKDRGTVMGIPPGSYENPRPLVKQVAAGFKIPARDPVFFPFGRKIQEHGLADQSLKGNAVKGSPAVDDVRRSVQMGTEMVAEADRLDRIAVLLQTFHFPELGPRITRPNRHGLLDREGQVNVSDHLLG
jgi:hypothetical protein